HHRRTFPVNAVGATSLASARIDEAGPSAPQGSMSRFRQSLPSLAVITALLAGWWVIVVQTESVIFPTPGQVITGTWELIENGTLWLHIGSSLFRVASGFLLAVALAVPLGLWMGWVQGAYATLNPLFQ